MKRYRALTGGVQVQPTDLEFISNITSEAIEMLASIYGNKTIILNGLTQSTSLGGGIEGGVVLYNGKPVRVAGVKGELTFNYTYCLAFEETVLATKVFASDGTRRQQPYVETIGVIGTCKVSDNNPLKLSSIERIDQTLASMLSKYFVGASVYSNDIKNINTEIAKKQDEFKIIKNQQFTLDSDLRTSSSFPLRFNKFGNVCSVGGGIEYAPDFSSAISVGKTIVSGITADFMPISPVIIPVYVRPWTDNQRNTPYYLFELNLNTIKCVALGGVSPQSGLYLAPTTYMTGI